MGHRAQLRTRTSPVPSGTSALPGPSPKRPLLPRPPRALIGCGNERGVPSAQQPLCTWPLSFSQASLGAPGGHLQLRLCPLLCGVPCACPVMTCALLTALLEGPDRGLLEIMLLRTLWPPGAGHLGHRVCDQPPTALTRRPRVLAATPSISNAARGSGRSAPAARPCWSPAQRLRVALQVGLP